MIDRITKNEEIFDNVTENIKNLEEELKKFKSNKKNIKLLNKYYGSKNWFKDKENYELGKIPKVKAGVLSEDSIWNMLDDVKDIISEMQKIIDYYNK